MNRRPEVGAGVSPLPAGFSVVLDPDTVVRSEGREVVGGDPPRTFLLSPHEARLLAELENGPVRTTEAGALARRLVDCGVAHPRPPKAATPGKIAVVIPVRDRAADLDRLLRSLDASEDAGMVEEVLVVDDGSQDPEAVASAAVRNGARLIVRPVNGGPAAARNSGLAACAADVEYVAFLDSDCVPQPGWLAPLVAHFADPEVGAVAPRVRPADPGGRSVLGTYSVTRFPLDLGGREALVRPGSRVGYLPTVALVVRRSAVGSAVFDEGLRYGEDVDAVWRLADSGWRVRYEPGVKVAHSEPETWREYLARRYHYGTCAGPLALRHPDRIAAIMLRPGPAIAAAALLTACPALAGVLLGASVCDLSRHLRRAGLPEAVAKWATAQPVGATMVGLGRAFTQAGLPVLTAAVLAPGRRGRRLAVLGALAIAPALRDWMAARPPVDPVRWTLASLADDIAHGAGVWRGAIRSRTVAPLLPRFRPNRSRKPRAGERVTRQTLQGVRNISAARPGRGAPNRGSETGRSEVKGRQRGGAGKSPPSAPATWSEHPARHRHGARADPPVLRHPDRVRAPAPFRDPGREGRESWAARGTGPTGGWPQKPAQRPHLRRSTPEAAMAGLSPTDPSLWMSFR